MIVDWELDSARVKDRLAQAESGHKVAPSPQEYQSLPALVKVEWLAEKVPGVAAIDLEQAEPQLKLEIPYQNLQVQEYNFKVAEDWRKQTRTLFTHYLEVGYYIADFFTLPGEHGQQAFYLLQKDEMSHALRNEN